MIKLKSMHTRLLVDDVEAVSRFYHAHFGLVPRFDDAGGVYQELEGNGIILGIFRRDMMCAAVGITADVPLTPAPEKLVICLEVDDVDEVVEKLSEAGLKPVSSAADQVDWMLRVAHYRDPAGNLIEINSAIPA